MAQVWRRRWEGGLTRGLKAAGSVAFSPPASSSWGRWLMAGRVALPPPSHWLGFCEKA